jgi:hypothetical protein
VDPAKAKLPKPAPSMTSTSHEPAADAGNIKSTNILEDRLLWLKGADWNNYLPSSAAAARALQQSGFPMDMLVPTGELIKGWVAIGNNGEPHEMTKSYRLVTFTAEAKKEIKALADILGEDALKKNGVQLLDWSWQPLLTSLEAKRGATKAAEDSANALQPASEAAKQLGEGSSSLPAGTEAAVRDLMSSMLHALQNTSGAGRGRGRGRGGGRGRSGGGRGRGRGPSN